jgi:hypothetical protein
LPHPAGHTSPVFPRHSLRLQRRRADLPGEAGVIGDNGWLRPRPLRSSGWTRPKVRVPTTRPSHARFPEKYSLPFTLLADTGHRVADDYGVWERNRYGRKSMGIDRSTFVIDEHGNVARALRRVKPEGHAERVLEALPG